MIEVTYRPGSYPRVTRDALVYLRDGGAALVCERASSGWTRALTPKGMELAVATDPDGLIACAWKDANAPSGVWGVVEGDAVPKQYPGKAFAQDSIGLHWDGAQFVISVQRSYTLIEQIAMPSGELVRSIEIPVSTDGLRDVLADGTVLPAKYLAWPSRTPTLSVTRLDRELFQPVTRDGWTVGQINGTDAIVLAGPDRAFQVLGGPAYRPRLVVDGDTIRVSAGTPRGAALVTVRPPYPAHEPVTPPVTTIPPFAHPTAVAWFFEDSRRPSVQPSPAPGQWSIVVESGVRPVKPVILALVGDHGEDLIAEWAWAGRWESVRGIYVADESSRETLRDHAILARIRMRARGLPLRPVYSYSADRLWTDIPEIDVLGVQCYPEPGETPAAARHRWGTRLQTVAGKRVWLVCGAYDRRPLAGIDEAQLRAMVPVYAALAASVKAETIGMFAWGRIGGASSFSGLRPILMSLASAVVTTPEEDDVLNAPGVEILSWEPIGSDKTARLVRFTDRNNPQVGVIEVVLDEGFVRASIENAAGRDKSSRRDRKVI